MKKSDGKNIILGLKNQIAKKFPCVKFVNEYDKNGTTIIEIYTNKSDQDALSDLTSKLCTDILINYGMDVLVLVYDNPKVLEWYVDRESN